MKITTKEVTKFREEDLLDIVKNSLAGFNLLEKGDLLAIFNLFCAVAGDKKPDMFVTICPLILENRKMVEKNIGIKIKTPKEIVEGDYVG